VCFEVCELFGPSHTGQCGVFLQLIALVRIQTTLMSFWLTDDRPMTTRWKWNRSLNTFSVAAVSVLFYYKKSFYDASTTFQVAPKFVLSFRRYYVRASASVCSCRPCVSVIKFSIDGFSPNVCQSCFETNVNSMDFQWLKGKKLS